MLIYLQDNDELFNTELINNVVTAEIPDENLYPELYKLVKQNMDPWSLWISKFNFALCE